MVEFDQALLNAALLFISALIFDNIHYLYAAIQWSKVQEKADAEKNATAKTVVYPPESITRHMKIFWRAKVACVLV